jgi:hypothetical protein
VMTVLGTRHGPCIKRARVALCLPVAPLLPAQTAAVDGYEGVGVTLARLPPDPAEGVDNAAGRAGDRGVGFWMERLERAFKAARP